MNLAKVISQIMDGPEIRILPGPPRGNQELLIEDTGKRDTGRTIFVIMGGEKNDEGERTSKRPHFDIAISFSDKDLEGVSTPHQDSLVISLVIEKVKMLHVW